MYYILELVYITSQRSGLSRGTHLVVPVAEQHPCDCCYSRANSILSSLFIAHIYFSNVSTNL